MKINEVKDKKHWYDGLFYDKLIAPNQDRLFREIRKLIEPGSTVLDVGCGTGRLAFQLSSHCKSVTGIDLSSKNILVANKNLQKKKLNNVEFIHGGAKDLVSRKNNFDYAVITYVIHEVHVNERVAIIKNMKAVANKIIIGDYITPTPNTLWGKINVVVEYLAGSDHYNNFINYVNNGGIKSLIGQSNMTIISEIENSPQTAHLVLAE